MRQTTSVPAHSKTALRSLRSAAVILLSLVALAMHAADEPPMVIQRAAGPITLDGDLSDAGWQGALKFEQWFETNPGDNIEPKVKTIGYITYDDRYFYAAVHAFDPDPSSIRAQIGDYDGISGNSDDFAGVLLDTRNDGKTAIELFVSTAGTQFDAVIDDTTGAEDASPNFFWDSSMKRTSDGFILEIRVPFTSLRYEQSSPQTWGVIMYRNMPRERRYQMFTHKLPRGANCFVCSYNKVTGFTDLPGGGHMVIAPYATAKAEGELRTNSDELVNHPAVGDGGIDVKWTPNEHTAIDATLNPDFSQIESDVAQISTNERFAINFPEKRPFFLERVELFRTPIQAVYTRNITSPRWGLRATGNFNRDSYTLLVADDRGGGLVIMPSSTGSHTANQDFDSRDLVARWRRDVGKTSFLSFLVAGREIDGGGNNRVYGPDFQWKPNDTDTVTAQLLLSQSATPNLPELDPEWNGQKLSSHAGDLRWSRSSPAWDYFAQYRDFGDGFRADIGFVPQVGFRMNYGEIGRTYRPTGFFNRVRVFGMSEYDAQQNDHMLYRLRSGGFGADGKFRSFIRLRFADESIRNTDAYGRERVLQRQQLLYNLQFAINRHVPQVSFDGWVGEDIDFYNNRVGDGARINMTASLRPTSKLQMSLTTRVQWLNEVNEAGVSGRLFTSQVERLRAQYMFTPKMFLRTVVQNTRTSRNPEIYGIPDLQRRTGGLSSQLLFAYRVNWQSVLYVGYGDIRGVTEEETPDPDDPTTRNVHRDLLLTNRQIFLKVSYAFQR